MRVVEHRRHSRRDPAGVHLNVEGLELVRRLRPTIGRFDRVVASPKPRALETAQSLGFEVDALLPDLAEMPEDAGVNVAALEHRSFAEYVRWVGRSEVASRYARHQAEVMRAELEKTPDGGRMLMVSHGGVIEFAAAGTEVPEVAGWGPPVEYLEGVRFYLDRGRWVRGEVLRL